MTNLEQRSPFHWSTAWARRVGARVADLVDLIAATCHEALGVSSATIADAIKKRIVVPLVRCHYFPRRRMKLGILKQTIDYYLRVPLIRASLPKWWQSFAGYETWVHDGTCGNPKDWSWLLEHWPSLATGYRSPIFRVGQSMREVAKVLVKFGFCADDYLRCVEVIKKKLIELTTRPSVVLPAGCELEFVEVPPRRFGYSVADLVDPRCHVSQPRSCGKQEAMRQYAEMLKAEGLKVEPIPANLLKPEHVEAGDRESNRMELGVYARIEAQRRALARDFPGFARRYFDTGHMKRSVIMGENAGINALTGAMTCWIPTPEEAEPTQEPLRELYVPEGADLELSGPVWGPSPTREFFMQLRARRKERPVREKFRVVVNVPLRENAEVTELVCQQIASIITPSLPERLVVKILCDEDGHIVTVPRVGEDEAPAIVPVAGEPAVSGDEIKEDGTAPDLKDEDETPSE